MAIDATRIVHNLWQGSFPAAGGELAGEGFKVAVFCAQEFQPRRADYPGLDLLLRCGFDDADRPPTLDEVDKIERAAKDAVRLAISGNKVLISCAAGRNRSGVVMARALTLIGFPARQAIVRVQTLRKDALTNQHFVRWLEDGSRRAA